MNFIQNTQEKTYQDVLNDINNASSDEVFVILHYDTNEERNRCEYYILTMDKFKLLMQGFYFGRREERDKRYFEYIANERYIYVNIYVSYSFYDPYIQSYKMIEKFNTGKNSIDIILDIMKNEGYFGWEEPFNENECEELSEDDE